MPDTAERRRVLFAEAVRLLEGEGHRDLPIDEAAHLLATSRRQLQRVLAEVGGTNYTELVLRVRMRAARRALQDESRRVRDIAQEAGYAESSDFSKAFRRLHGMSPSEYRSRISGGGSDETHALRHTAAASGHR